MRVEALKSIFCSELVAMVYQRVGLLPDQLAFNEYTLEDFKFASSRYHNFEFPMKHGYLEKEIYVDFVLDS